MSFSVNFIKFVRVRKFTIDIFSNFCYNVLG